MLKRRNRIYRRIAVALTVALLAGQSHAFVLAEEDADGAPQMEITGEADTSTPDNGSETGGSNTDNGSTENGGGEGNGGSEQGGNDGADDQNPEDNGNNGDQQGDGDDQTSCICGTKCAADVVNTDCPVCAADYEACTGKADDAGNNGSGNDDMENNDPENGGQDNTNSQNAEIEVNPSEDEVLPEMVLGNMSDEEAGIATQADEGVEDYRDCRVSSSNVDFTDDNDIGYKVIGDGEVEAGWGWPRGEEPSGSVVIPGEVTDNNGDTYKVTRIRRSAFYGCRKLISIVIPEGVTHIGEDAFNACTSLRSVNMPDSVKEIGAYAFTECWNLGSIKIPEGVTSIEVHGFYGCRKLKEIKFPNSMKMIGTEAFCKCASVEWIEIPDGVAICETAFMNCTQLKLMKIIVTKETAGPATIIKEFGNPPFNQSPESRNIVFKNNDGTNLSGTDLSNAKYVYIEAGKKDDKPNDGKWYGWSVGELSETVDTCKVTINVKKDGSPWTTGCDRKFALTKDGGTTFVTNLDAVEAGSYEIYDVTDSGNKLNTGVTVPVANTDASNNIPVDYYTVAFCYLDDTGKEQIYGDDTPWKPQTILKKAGRVAKPADPPKAGHTFDKWVTASNTDEEFKFADISISTTGTKIYAKWEKKTAIDSFRISATATEGGTIDPKDEVIVSKGGERTFTITPDEGYRIKSVTVDDEDVTAELKDTLARAQAGTRYYTFTNVTKDHTIYAEFERDGSSSGGGGGDHSNPDGGGNNGGDNINPDGGNGTETSSAQAGSGTVVTSAGNNAASVSSKEAGASGESVNGSASSTSGQTAGAGGTTANGKEPKTGDASYLEVYATLAMIAGLTYLLLYVMEESRGMSEREKEAFVAAFIRWGKKGGTFRKCCAMAAIFCLLAYYHIIGKNVGGNALREKHLGQAF